MKTLVAIGEALIDFAPQQAGRQIKDTESFMPKVGGAPAQCMWGICKTWWKSSNADAAWSRSVWG